MLLLACSAVAYAQDGAVTLADKKTTVSWSDFVDAINNGITATIDESYQTAVNTKQGLYDDAVAERKEAADTLTERKRLAGIAEKLYKAANDSLSDIINEASTYSPKTGAPQWLEDAIDDATLFQTAYFTPGTTVHYNIWYKTSTYKGVTTLSLSYEDPGTGEGSWTKTDSDEGFYDYVVNPNNKDTEGYVGTVGSLQVYLGKNSQTGKYNYGSTGYYIVANFTKENIPNNVVSALTNLRTQVPQENTSGYQALLNSQAKKTAWKNKLLAVWNEWVGKVESAQTTYDEAVSAETDALDELNDAKDALKQAQDNADENAEKNYKTIYLNEDVVVTTPIVAFSGTIYGALNTTMTPHIINLGEGVAEIFDTFSGTLRNVAVNGTFAGALVNATFYNVAYNSGTTFKLYDNEGSATSYTSLGALGFAARDKYGVNFANKKLVALGEENANIVYSITVYNSPTDNKPYYVTKNGTELTTLTSAGATKVAVGANVFVKSQTNDLAGINNVFYEDENGNYVSDVVVITDKTNFYCPAEITPTSLSYTRTFGTGYNAVCLPFDIDESTFSGDAYVCTYDAEENGKFWFTSVAGTIPANTPALVLGKEGVTSISLNTSGLTLKATPADQVQQGKGDGDNSQSYGTFKTLNAGEFKGQHNAGGVYGLSGNMFQPAGDKANFPAFRMIVWTKTAVNTQSDNAPAPRKIGVRDEMGREITIGGGTSAIEDVKADEAPAFSIKGGVGELTITSENELGKVEVYALDGRLAAVANVTEGTTSVSLQSGLYIVMGKKVIVK